LFLPYLPPPPGILLNLKIELSHLLWRGRENNRNDEMKHFEGPPLEQAVPPGKEGSFALVSLGL